MQEQLNNFSRLIGATISKTWSLAVIHVVASTDADGSCRRTMKFLMSILEGKWVLKIDCKFI
jgi:BRCA1-associated RING domain protein 1